tara:strand:+ start:2034 stop:2612 length:579 start_codon:yes stop_codon:yes gene_type:complete
MSDTDEIFDTGEPEIVEQKKKGRRPMSEERKQQLREQLKKARDAKKAKKDSGEPLAKGKSKVKKMLEATEEEPAVYVKAVKRVGKDHSEDIKSLKEEIANMKNSQGSDLTEVRELKAELKELRDLAKQYKLQKKAQAVVQPQAKAKAKAKAVAKPNPYGEPKTVAQAKPIDIPKPVKKIYSAYKKSIWSQFT